MDDELRRRFEDDQAERRQHPAFGTPEYRALRARDAERRARVRELARAGQILDPADCYHAAMILHHGDTEDDAREASELALEAARRSHRPARRLAAAAHDRFLMVQGKPQKYGTQIVPDGIRQRLWDVGPATADAERAEWDVPPLAEMERRAEEVTRLEPMPPMEEAPEWLKQALRRWGVAGSRGEG